MYRVDSQAFGTWPCPRSHNRSSTYVDKFTSSSTPSGRASRETMYRVDSQAYASDPGPTASLCGKGSSTPDGRASREPMYRVDSQAFGTWPCPRSHNRSSTYVDKFTTSGGKQEWPGDDAGGGRRRPDRQPPLAPPPALGDHPGLSQRSAPQEGPHARLRHVPRQARGYRHLHLGRRGHGRAPRGGRAQHLRHWAWQRRWPHFPGRPRPGGPRGVANGRPASGRPRPGGPRGTANGRPASGSGAPPDDVLLQDHPAHLRHAQAEGFRFGH
mmetsp:Transcript_109294/g.352818  ORF Transcript_109294/g.352818 Transcript_109294/m.352818 type:complete len:270 (+) Transcript_109294:2-811(+)